MSRGIVLVLRRMDGGGGGSSLSPEAASCCGSGCVGARLGGALGVEGGVDHEGEPSTMSFGDSEAADDLAGDTESFLTVPEAPPLRETAAAAAHAAPREEGQRCRAALVLSRGGDRVVGKGKGRGVFKRNRSKEEGEKGGTGGGGRKSGGLKRTRSKEEERGKQEEEEGREEGGGGGGRRREEKGMI